MNEQNEKIENTELSEQEKIDKAKEEFEKAKAEQAEKVVKAIYEGWQEAKRLADDLAAKTLSTWFTEKDLARQLKVEVKRVQGVLMHIDRFGFLETKVVGPSMQLRVNRTGEYIMNRLLRDRGAMVEKLSQLEALMAIVADDFKPKEEKEGSLAQEDKVNENNDTNDIMMAVK